MENTTEQVVKYGKVQMVKEKQERFILLVDIMGFSAFVQRTPYDEARRRLEAFRESLDLRITNLQFGDYLHFAFFSDSVVVITEGDTDADLNRISKAGVVLMQESFKNGFAIKGGLAFGEFYYDPEKNIFFGLPLVEAYQLGDQELKYYGIIVHHTAEVKIRESAEKRRQYLKSFPLSKKKRRGNNPYVYSKVPLKSTGWSCHCHLAWYLYDSKLQSPVDNTLECDRYLEQIELTVSGAARIYIDNTREVMKADLKLYQNYPNDKKINSIIVFPMRED
jgi:hypothetical protein